MLDVNIDRSGPVALHDQVAAQIRRAIADGEAGPGERLPLAKDLAAVLGVKKNTVLRALHILREEGLLEFRRGRGSRWAAHLSGPLLADTSAQARAGHGYARADFTIDYDIRTVTCPQGKTAATWTPCTQRGQAAVVATFAASDCGPCPARALGLPGFGALAEQGSALGGAGTARL
jgi:DNA-binding transcriptional regulator YhcF (GntR family)